MSESVLANTQALPEMEIEQESLLDQLNGVQADILTLRDALDDLSKRVTSMRGSLQALSKDLMHQRQGIADAGQVTEGMIHFISGEAP